MTIATDDDGNSDSLAVAVTVTDVTESAFLTLSGIADSNQAENSAYTSATPSLSALPSAPSTPVAMMWPLSPSIPSTVWWKWSLAILKAPPILDPITSTTTHSLPPMTMATQTASLLLSPSPMSPNRLLSHSPESPIPISRKFRPHIRHSRPERTPIGSVTHTLGGDDVAFFTVNLPLRGGMVARDFESPADSGSNNVYNHTLIATDDDGNSDSLAVAVTVTDVTESAPSHSPESPIPIKLKIPKPTHPPPQPERHSHRLRHLHTAAMMVASFTVNSSHWCAGNGRSRF